MTSRRTSGISRREFLRFASVSTAGSLLAACAPQRAVTPDAAATGAPQPTTAPSGSKPDAIQWWVGWGELVPFFDGFKQMAKYKELMGDGDVEMKPSIENEALLTAVAAGTPPDMAANVPYLDLFARDVCVDIGPWVSGSSIIKKDSYISGNWDGGFYKGVQYGVPTLECFVRFGMDYNTRMVEAAGLDPEKPPVTWDETLDWHTKLTTFDDAGNLKTIGLDPMDAEGSHGYDDYYAIAEPAWAARWPVEDLWVARRR